MKTRKRIIKKNLPNGKIKYICQEKKIFTWNTMTQYREIGFNCPDVECNAVFDTYEEASKFLGVGVHITKEYVVYEN